MKKIAISTLLICAVALPWAQADDAHHSDTDSPNAAQGTMAQGQGMMDMDRMQEHMKSMQQLMERIHKTDDPAAQQKLMSEHMQEMHKAMSDMRGMMMGPGMMKGGSEGDMGSGMMGGGTMMGNGKSLSMDDRQKMMEQRMDMMQGMMEQMMEQMMAQQGSMRSDMGMGKGKGKDVK